MIGQKNWPKKLRELLQKQRGLRYGKASKDAYYGKFRIARKFVETLRTEGWRVTHDDIREMLDYLQRGYTTDSQTISRLLHTVGTKKEQKEHKYPNGHPVEVSEGDRVTRYDSINKAADVHECSPESVRKWASTRRPNRRGQIWHYVDPARL